MNSEGVLWVTDIILVSLLFQRTCDYFPAIYAYIIAPAQGHDLTRSKIGSGGMSNACEMIFDNNENLRLPGQTIIFQVNEGFIEGWFIIFETASLCEEEIFQDLKVGINLNSGSSEEKDLVFFLLWL